MISPLWYSGADERTGVSRAGRAASGIHAFVNQWHGHGTRCAGPQNRPRPCSRTRTFAEGHTRTGLLPQELVGSGGPRCPLQEALDIASRVGSSTGAVRSTRSPTGPTATVAVPPLRTTSSCIRAPAANGGGAISWEWADPRPDRSGRCTSRVHPANLLAARAGKPTRPNAVNGSHTRPHCADAPVLQNHSLVPQVRTISSAYARDLWFFRCPGSVLHATRFG
jgi:hypothetical protein